jgi:phosphate transport system ATP-binding protein
MQQENNLAQNEGVFIIKDFTAYYGTKKGVKNVTMSIEKNKVTAIIGPSGCGKSTLIRSLNKINDTIPSFRTEGEIYFEGRNILERDVDTTVLRKKVGMVFQKPTPFPMSVYDNIAFGPKIHNIRPKSRIDEIVEESLRRSSLWNEVKDELHKSAWSFSGGQQQRICIARALAVEPEVILLDEPTSALDPIATKNIEVLLEELAERYTIVIVTHNLSQAIRISDYMAFMFQGELIEYGRTSEMVKRTKNPLTENYLSGKIG